MYLSPSLHLPEIAGVSKGHLTIVVNPLDGKNLVNSTCVQCSNFSILADGNTQVKISHSFKKNWPHCVILILTFTISSNADTEYSKKEKEYFNHSKSPYSYFFMCFSPFHKMFAFLNVNGKALFYFLSLSTVCSVVF